MNIPLQRLQALLCKLPGVGDKTAQRYILHMLASDDRLLETLGNELLSFSKEITICERCGNLAMLSEHALCEICLDERRDSSVLCVGARICDLWAIERSRALKGRYFVLGKLLSPLEGIGPEKLPLGKLRAFLASTGAKELILATPTTVEGEATALFLTRELQADALSITRIASGMPHGGEIEYADPITMGRAFLGRKSI